MSREPARGGDARGSRRDAGLVIGLGASAGGLEALETLLAHLPPSAGLAFVVVQHLDPHHRSMLAELLSRHTAMRVVEAADGTSPAPDHVHVIAPGTLLTLEGGVFKVTAAPDPSARAPIDVLFRSLAEDRGPGAVGVVLSGGGHDGTAGLRAIRERGGLTLAQAPETATRDDMPRSAMEAGVVDHVLPPEELASKLLDHAGHVRSAAGAGGAVPLDAELQERLLDLCEVVRRRTGHDFTRYKEGTLLRRIRRRLQVVHAASADAYLQLLEHDAAEAEALVKDLLIGVTQFFRDPDAFRALAREVVPRIVQARPPDAPVRIWVPGCASGEEVYSLAILVREHLERLGADRLVQIFATDLDAEMLGVARQGRYPLSIAELVSPERLARFFVRERDAYEVAKALREMCIFSQHSLIRDPPFSQLDLISCRNVLIYLGAELQRKLVPLFHYALRPGGFLFLGPSEGIAGSPELFDALDKKSKIFRRSDAVTRPAVEFPLSARTAARAPTPPPLPPAAPADGHSAREKLALSFERLVLDEYAHPCAVVDARGEIVLVAGPVARFLQLPAGTLTANLLEAVRGSLRVELRAALHAAAQSGRRVVRDRVLADVEDAPRPVRLVVRPMPGADPSASLFLVVVQERADPPGGDAPAPQLESPAVQHLEDELRATRAELRTTVEALEAANEELKSSNEELISTNEELQSANEELQTSKEELQSLNEELETVNAELRQKLEELATANGDLQNLFASTEIATIFLDRDLRVAKFTPAATALFRMRESDVGRPLGDLAPRFVGQDLVAESREVLRTLAPIERQVRAAHGESWFILRLSPYRTVENLIAGVVVTFVDVSQLKQAEEALRASEQRLRLFVEHAPAAVAMFDRDMRYVAASRRYLSDYRLSVEDVVGRSHYEVFPDVPERWKQIHRRSLAGAVERCEEDPFPRADGTLDWVRWELHPWRTAAGEIGGVVLFSEIVTERKRAAAERDRLARQRQLALDAARLGWWHYDPVTRSASYDRRYVEIFGVSGHERPNDEILKLLHPNDLPRVWAAVQAALDPADPKPYSAEYRIIRPDGALRWVEAHGVATFEGEGDARRATSLVGTVADVTERKATESRLAYLASFPGKNPNPIVEADAEGHVRYANPAALDLFPDILEKGAAHPWLSGWETVARPIHAGNVASGARDVTVGDRTFHQVLVHAAEEKVVRAYGLDVTERRRAEEALRESEERLRRSQEVAHLGSWELDLERNRLFWSDEVYRIFGLEPQEFGASYEAFLAAVHPDDRAAVDAAYTGSLRDGKDRYEIDHRIVRRATGEVRVVHEKCEHVRDASGRIVKSIGMVHDITERKHASEAVERSRQGLSRLADASLSVMSRTDLEGMLQAISEAALALTGARMATCGHGLVSGQLVVGGSARAPGAPACPPGNMFELDKGGVHMALVEGAESIRLTDAQLRSHGRWWGLPADHVPMRGLLGVAMRARSGRTNGLILVTDKERGDFTEEDTSLLQQLATVASLALQHVEARISLEGADRHKNEFLAMLSHELRNPLAPIRNSLHILDRAAPGGDQARRAQAVIDRQVAHMTRLVDELLDVTRISRGKIQLQRERLDLGEVVRRAVDDHHPTFVRNGLAVEVAIPDAAIWIDGDRTRIAQVIDNLLQNAAKFTPEAGKVAVSVEASRSLGEAVARVRDTGAGIAADMLPRLFEPFTQADTTLARTQGGLGLGLALVKGLVEMHGGAVSVESEGVGRGAQFTVRFPLKEEPARAHEPRRTARAHGPARRVLVIEDNADGAETLRDVLELGGHAVDVAYSGPAGIEKARAFGPEIVLCDIGLPGMDGYEVARRMRDDPALASLILVALTGYAGPDDVLRAREAGFDDHLAKPPSREDLERVLVPGRPRAP